MTGVDPRRHPVRLAFAVDVLRGFDPFAGGGLDVDAVVGACSVAGGAGDGFGAFDVAVWDHGLGFREEAAADGDVMGAEEDGARLEEQLEGGEDEGDGDEAEY